MTRRPNPEVMSMTDQDLEHQLIGSLLVYPHMIPTCIQIVDPTHFWDQDAGAAFQALTELAQREERIEVVMVADRTATLRREFDRRLLMEWMALPLIATPALAAERIRRLAMARRVRNELVEPRSRLIQGEDPWEVATDVQHALARLLEGADDAGGLELATAAEVLGRSDAAAPWRIPGLLRDRERMIFVAGEGAGKTTLVSQLSLCAEAGLHPFTRYEVEPARVMRIDLENPKHSVTRSVRLVVDAIHREPGMGDWEPKGLIAERPQGLDLLSPTGQRLLVQAIRRERPQILFIGPLYKMFRTAPGERSDSESIAQALAAFLDEIREEYGLALWIEAHAPKGEGGKGRDLNPIGSSVWHRWPEYGRTFRPADKSKSPKMKGLALDVGSYRGDRNPVFWPEQLVIGHHGWPFTGYYGQDIQLQLQGFR